MNETISASCSIAPDSLKSDSSGLFVPPLVSTALESWERAIIGMSNSFAKDFKFLDIVEISCSLFPDLLAIPVVINCK